MFPTLSAIGQILFHIIFLHIFVRLFTCWSSNVNCHLRSVNAILIINNLDWTMSNKSRFHVQAIRAIGHYIINITVFGQNVATWKLTFLTSNRSNYLPFDVIAYNVMKLSSVYYWHNAWAVLVASSTIVYGTITPVML